MREDSAALDVVSLYGGILHGHGAPLTTETEILDFRCGTGRHTYQLIDAGFPCSYGDDVVDYLNLRNAADHDRLRIDPNAASSRPLRTTRAWPDETFDFVVVTSVLEHVFDQDFVFGEVARVLKPGGVFLNIFPSRWRPIEANIYVPFGGVTRSPWWFALWARLGIRNEFQSGDSSEVAAVKNVQFAQEGINCLSGSESDKAVRRHFASHSYVEESFVAHSPGCSRHLASAIRVLPPLGLLFRMFHTRVILARK